MKFKKPIHVMLTTGLWVSLVFTLAAVAVLSNFFKDFSCFNVFVNNLTSANLDTILIIAFIGGIGVILGITDMVLALIRKQAVGVYWCFATIIAFACTAFVGALALTLRAEGSWVAERYTRVDVPFIVYEYYFCLIVVAACAVLGIVSFGLLIPYFRAFNPKPKAEEAAGEEGAVLTDENGNPIIAEGEENAESAESAEGSETAEGEEGSEESLDEEEVSTIEVPEQPERKEIKVRVVRENTENAPQLNKVYHVSKRQDGKWQVKAAKAQRAIKLFNTKAEAVTYANELAIRQDASTAVHASKGKNKGRIQKQ